MAQLVVKNSYFSIPVRQIFNDISVAGARYYFAIGRVQPWPDEDNPPIPFDNLRTEIETRENIVALKRVRGSDIFFGIRRINWELGEVYDHWDDQVGQDTINSLEDAYSVNIKNSDFYVLTRENNVYKCIWNNNGSPSLIEPSGTGIRVFKTEDGYRWKFMFKLSPLEIEKFLTDDVIPVKLFTSLNGGIEQVILTNGGSGYTSTPTVEIVGDGQGAEITAVVEGGEVTGFIILSSGNQYTQAEVRIIGGQNLDPNGDPIGDPATAIALISFDSSLQRIVQDAAVNGSIEQAVILQEGQNYLVPPTIRIRGNGTGATAIPVLNNSVNVINVDFGGFDYQVPPIVTFQGGEGSGATATATLTNGVVTAIAVTNGGAGYITAPSVLITRAPGDTTGQGAIATATIISDGKIRGIEITNPGSGYTKAVIEVIPATTNEDGILLPIVGSGATARAIISPIGGHGSKAFSELFADKILLTSVLDFKEDFPDIFLNNEFRQVSLLRNPLKFNSVDQFATDITLNAGYVLSCLNPLQLQDDDILLNDTTFLSSNVGDIVVRIITIRNSQVFVQAIGNVDPYLKAYPTNNNQMLLKLRNQRNGIEYTFSSLTVPELDVFSGDLLYTDNRLSLLRAQNQTENIRAILEF